MRRGRRFAVPIAVLSVLTSTADSPSRVGVIVSKKVGNSVVRHAVARKIRHAGWDLVRSFPHGIDLVVRAQPGAETATVADWSQSLLKYAEKTQTSSRSESVTS